MACCFIKHFVNYFLLLFRAGKETAAKPQVETYESLLSKKEVVENEVVEIGAELKSLTDLAKEEKKKIAQEKELDKADEEEDLDAYMDKLKKGTSG